MGLEADKSIYNDDELVSPDWMNTEFFEKVLRKYENDSVIVVSDYQISPASKKGDHYASIMYRIQIDYNSSKSEKPKNISIILKTEPYVEGVKKDMVTKVNLFDCEIKMYSETLPEIEKLIKMTGDERRLHPALIYYSQEPAPLIIFEDVSPYDYGTCKDFGVNYDLSKLAFHRLGQIHAASMVLHENNVDVDYYKKSMFHMDALGEGLDMFMLNVNPFLDEMKTWPEYEDYAEKIEKLLENHNEKGRKTFTPSNGGYNVLNHGDFHSKNMMYTNIMNPKDAEILVIDFQLCIYGTPAIDLIYAQYMMTNSDRKDELVTYYYKVFVDSLKKMGFKGSIPTYEDLRNELKINGYYDVLLAISCLPFQEFDLSEIFEDLFDPVKGIPIRKLFYKSSKVQNMYKKLLPQFLEKGYFDL